VHIRNRAGRTPLFLAASAGLTDHVLLLRKSGAHLHSEELPLAELYAKQKPGIWELAGIGPKTTSDGDVDEEGGRRYSVGNGNGKVVGSALSSP